MISSNGCHKVVYPKNLLVYIYLVCFTVNTSFLNKCLYSKPSTHSDKLVEIIKLDEHYMQAAPLRRMQKNSINTIALNPIEDNYILAIGFESGNIELLSEQSSNYCVFSGKKDSVLSLALSAQV